MQKDFVKFGTKSFSFAFLFFVLHETKNLSRVNVFECIRTQTLDKPFILCRLASNRVKAKNALTLELNHIDMQNRHMALCHSERKPMA